jgi:PAS domain S-box-containing protein
MSFTAHRPRILPVTGRRVSKAQRFALLAAACGLCFPLAALGGAYVHIVLSGDRKSLTVQTWVAHTHEAIVAIASVMASADDAETGQRGFLLTGNASYLEPYEESIKKIWLQFANLESLTTDNLTQQGHLQVLRFQLQNRLARHAATIELARDGDLLAAIDNVRQRQDKVLMDAVRATIAAMDAEEERLLQGRLADQLSSQRAASDAVRFLVMFGIASTLLGGTATIAAIWIGRARFAATAAERQRLLNMLDLAPIMMRDFDGTIRFWSEGCRRLFGWTAEQAVGQLSHELLRTQFPVPRSELNTSLLQKGEWTGELRNRTQDDTTVIVFARKLLGDRTDGRSFGIMETVTDITSLRKSEADLQAARRA